MNRPLDPEVVMREACKYYRINTWDFRHKAGRRVHKGSIRDARLASVRVLSDSNCWGCRDVADWIGWSSHSTALRCLECASERHETDPAFAAAVEIIARRAAGAEVTA